MKHPGYQVQTTNTEFNAGWRRPAIDITARSANAINAKPAARLSRHRDGLRSGRQFLPGFRWIVRGCSPRGSRTSAPEDGFAGSHSAEWCKGTAVPGPKPPVQTSVIPTLVPAANPACSRQGRRQFSCRSFQWALQPNRPCDPHGFPGRIGNLLCRKSVFQ